MQRTGKVSARQVARKLKGTGLTYVERHVAAKAVVREGAEYAPVALSRRASPVAQSAGRKLAALLVDQGPCACGVYGCRVVTLPALW